MIGDNWGRIALKKTLVIGLETRRDAKEIRTRNK